MYGRRVLAPVRGALRKRQLIEPSVLSLPDRDGRSGCTVSTFPVIDKDSRLLSFITMASKLALVSLLAAAKCSVLRLGQHWTRSLTPVSVRRVLLRMESLVRLAQSVGRVVNVWRWALSYKDRYISNSFFSLSTWLIIARVERI